MATRSTPAKKAAAPATPPAGAPRLAPPLPVPPDASPRYLASVKVGQRAGVVHAYNLDDGRIGVLLDGDEDLTWCDRAGVEVL